MKNITKPTSIQDIKREWYLIDVKSMILGRIATRIATLLMGKAKPYFVNYLDCGDYVVVLNSSRIKVTGKKSDQKTYMKYSGYPAGLKIKTFTQVLIENPNKIIYEAVSGMLPNNKLRDKMLKRLYIFADDKHPYIHKINKKN